MDLHASDNKNNRSTLSDFFVFFALQIIQFSTMQLKVRPTATLERIRGVIVSRNRAIQIDISYLLTYFTTMSVKAQLE